MLRRVQCKSIYDQRLDDCLTYISGIWGVLLVFQSNIYESI